MKRILFVDDQPNILGGLQRMLHGQRKVWNMSFVESGEEALAAMEEAPFDVVVTDMKMPIMSGAQLLKQVHERYPKTVRIVLSGYADLEAAMQSVAVSHQFLAKPCDSDTLKSVVNRACGLAELLNEETLKETLGAISELPVATAYLSGAAASSRGRGGRYRTGGCDRRARRRNRGQDPAARQLELLRDSQGDH